MWGTEIWWAWLKDQSRIHIWVASWEVIQSRSSVTGCDFQSCPSRSASLIWVTPSATRELSENKIFGIQPFSVDAEIPFKMFERVIYQVQICNYFRSEKKTCFMYYLYPQIESIVENQITLYASLYASFMLHINISHQNLVHSKISLGQVGINM